jgi:hypothetical protein
MFEVCLLHFIKKGVKRLVFSGSDAFAFQPLEFFKERRALFFQILRLGHAASVRFRDVRFSTPG